MPGKRFEIIVRAIPKDQQNRILFVKRVQEPEKPHNQQLHTITFHFTGEYHGDIKLKTDENSEYRFFQENELIKRHDIAWNHKEVALEILNR